MKFVVQVKKEHIMQIFTCQNNQRNKNGKIHTIIHLKLQSIYKTINSKYKTPYSYRITSIKAQINKIGQLKIYQMKKQK